MPETIVPERSVIDMLSDRIVTCVRLTLLFSTSFVFGIHVFLHTSQFAQLILHMKQKHSALGTPFKNGWGGR